MNVSVKSILKASGVPAKYSRPEKGRRSKWYRDFRLDWPFPVYHQIVHCCLRLQSICVTPREAGGSDPGQTSMKLAAAILVLSAAPALAVELPPDLAKAVQDYDRAQIHNDIPTLERLVADDYVLVNSNATVENKQQFLADFSLPGFKIDPYVVEQPVEKMWGNAAVIGGLVHLSWTQDGKHQTRLLRVAYVWAKRNGHWQATYTQVTRVPQ
jgi:ketosteroid isomerase-like protein